MTRNDRFDSTAMLLKDIWFAKDSIDFENKTIDWDAIESRKESIAPSSSEEILVDLATQLWTGYGKTMDMFLKLDSNSQVKVIESLRIRFGYMSEGLQSY